MTKKLLPFGFARQHWLPLYNISQNILFCVSQKKRQTKILLSWASLMFTSGSQVRLVYLQSGSVDITLYTASPDDARNLNKVVVKDTTVVATVIHLFIGTVCDICSNSAQLCNSGTLTLLKQTAHYNSKNTQNPV